MELKNSIVYHMERELWNFKLVFLILMIVLFWLMNSMGAILSALKGAFSRYIYQYYGHLVSRSKLLYSGAGQIGTLAFTDASSQYAPTRIINQEVLDYYTPLQATGISFSLVMCGFVFIGIVIYLVNRSERMRGMGMAAAVFFILLDPLMIFLMRKKRDGFPPCPGSVLNNWRLLKSRDIRL